MNAPHLVIDRQIDAYNRGDIDEFVACYAPHAKVFHADGSLLASGHEEIRAHYGVLFAKSPGLRAEVKNRMEVGLAVIDEEYVTGFVVDGLASEVHAVVAYRVMGHVIEDAHLYR
jgi:hypothetical protein